MEETSYPILLNLKIPWLAKTFNYLFQACLVILFLLVVYMLPSMFSSGEMKAAYFILTTTEVEKKLILFALIGAPLFILLELLSRYKKEAVLKLLPGTIEIDDYKTITSYSIDEITHIACNDALWRDGVPKGKLSIDIKDKSQKVTRFTLIHYHQSDQLMEMLFTYENIKFHITNFYSNPEHLREN